MSVACGVPSRPSSSVPVKRCLDSLWGNTKTGLTRMTRKSKSWFIASTRPFDLCLALGRAKLWRIICIAKRFRGGASRGRACYQIPRFRCILDVVGRAGWLTAVLNPATTITGSGSGQWGSLIHPKGMHEYDILGWSMWCFYNSKSQKIIHYAPSKYWNQKECILKQLVL